MKPALRDPSKGWLEMLEEAERVKHWFDCTLEEKVERWQQVIRVLRSLTPHQKKHHFNMESWAEKTTCGTVACAAGHAGMDRWFISQGFELKLKGVAQIDWSVDPKDFFGPEGYWSIFLTRANSVTEVIGKIRRHIDWIKETYRDK